MLDIECKLLTYIQQHQPVSYTDLLNGFCASGSMSYVVCDDILQCLLEDRLLIASAPVKDRRTAAFHLPSRTTQILYQYAQDCAEEARREQLQSKCAKIGACAAIAGAVAGAVTGSLLTFFLGHLM